MSFNSNKYDAILNSKDVSFEVKVQNLIEVWRNISELNLKDFEAVYVLQIIDWAKLHALNIVLMGEWRQTKEESHDTLLEAITKAQHNLNTRNKNFGARCQKLLDVVKKPWEDPILNTLLNSKDAEIGPQEIEFFCVETAYLISVRLKKLCENHCEDLALNLTSNFLRCNKLSKEQNFTLSANETQIWYIVDTQIALLYKFHDKARIIRQFEELELKDGVELIKRFSKKRVQISKIWKHCHKIAMFGARFFLSKALMNFNVDTRRLLLELMRVYINLSNTEALTEEFIGSVRSITNLADAAGLCALCEIIHQEAGDKLRHFAIEMYIRALTTDMNELERLKHQNEHEKVDPTTSRLANSFMNLSELLDKHVNVARECVLTSFSLDPTKKRLQKIEDMAKRSGFEILDTGQEWKCKLHPPVLPTDDLAWKCSDCGDWMCKPTLTTAIQTNFALNEALQPSVLGISQALCDDLVVCLSNPRYQVLSWLLEWNDLYRLCIMYLNDPEKTKNFVTELKFVDIDYTQFQHIKKEPLDEYSGIEKGYEQYLDLDFVSDEEYSESEVSRDSQYSSSKTTEDSLSSILPQKAESNPVTLKSLRMFRPNLKRKKEQESEPQTELKKVKLPVSVPISIDSNANNMYVNKSEVVNRPSNTTSTNSSFGATYALKPQTCTKPAVNYSTNKNVNKMDLPGHQNISSVHKNPVLKSSIKTCLSSNVYKKPSVAPFPGATTAARNYEAELLRNFADTVNSSYKSQVSKQTNQTVSSEIKSTIVTTGATSPHRNKSELDLFDNFIKELTGSKNTSKLTEGKQNTTTTSKLTEGKQNTTTTSKLTEGKQSTTITTSITESTESKNVEAATLLRLGGQLVAQASHQPIQVPLLTNKESLCSTHETQDNSVIQTDKIVKIQKRSRSLENFNNNRKIIMTRGRTLERGNQSCSQEFLHDSVSSQTPRSLELQVRLTPIPSVQMEQLLQSKQTQAALSSQERHTRTPPPLQESLSLKQMGQKLVVMLERLTPKHKLSKEPSCSPRLPLPKAKPQAPVTVQRSTTSLSQVDPDLIIPLEKKVPSLIVQLERLLCSGQLQKRNTLLQTAPAYSLRQTSLRPCRQNYLRVQKSMPSSAKEIPTISAEQELPLPPPETSLLYQTENQVCARLRLLTAKNKQSFSTASVQVDSSHMPAPPIQPVAIPVQEHPPLLSSRCSPPVFHQQQTTDIHCQEKTIITDQFTLNPINALPRQPQTVELLYQDQESSQECNQELSLPPLPPILLERLAPSPLRQEVKSNEELSLPLLTIVDSQMPPLQDLESNQELVRSLLQIPDNPVVPFCHPREYHYPNTVSPLVSDLREEVKSFRQIPQMSVLCNTTLPSPLEIPTLALTIQMQTTAYQYPLELAKDTQITYRNLSEAAQARQIMQAISRQSQLEDTRILVQGNQIPVQVVSHLTVRDIKALFKNHQKSEAANQTSTLIPLKLKLLKRQDLKSFDLLNDPKSQTVPISLMDPCLEPLIKTTIVPLQTLLNKPQTSIQIPLRLINQTALVRKEPHLIGQSLSQMETSSKGQQTLLEQQPLSHNLILPCLLFPSQNQITGRPVKVILSKSSVENLLSGFIKNQLQPMALSFNSNLVKKQNKSLSCRMKSGNSILMRTLEQEEECPMDGDSNYETVYRDGIPYMGKSIDRTNYFDSLNKIDDFFKLTYESINSDELESAVQDVDQIFPVKKSRKTDTDTDDDIVDDFSDAESEQENIKEMCEKLCARLYSDLITEHNYDIGKLDLTIELPFNLTSVAVGQNDIRSLAFDDYVSEQLDVDLRIKPSKSINLKEKIDRANSNSTVDISTNESNNLEKRLFPYGQFDDSDSDSEIECKFSPFKKLNADFPPGQPTFTEASEKVPNQKRCMESFFKSENQEVLNKDALKSKNYLGTDFITAQKSDFNENFILSESRKKLANEKYWNKDLENLATCESPKLKCGNSNNKLDSYLEFDLKQKLMNSSRSITSIEDLSKTKNDSFERESVIDEHNDLKSDDQSINLNGKNINVENLKSNGCTVRESSNNSAKFCGNNEKLLEKEKNTLKKKFIFSDDGNLLSNNNSVNSNNKNINMKNSTDNVSLKLISKSNIDITSSCCNIHNPSVCTSITFTEKLTNTEDSDFKYFNHLRHPNSQHVNTDDFTEVLAISANTKTNNANLKKDFVSKESSVKSIMQNASNELNYIEKSSESKKTNFGKLFAFEDDGTSNNDILSISNKEKVNLENLKENMSIKCESGQMSKHTLLNCENLNAECESDTNADSGLELGSNGETDIKSEFSDLEYDNSAENIFSKRNGIGTFWDSELSDDSISELFPSKKSIYLKTDNGDDLDKLCKDLEKELAKEYFDFELKKIERATNAMKQSSFRINASKIKDKGTQTSSRKLKPIEKLEKVVDIKNKENLPRDDQLSKTVVPIIETIIYPEDLEKVKKPTFEIQIEKPDNKKDIANVNVITENTFENFIPPDKKLTKFLRWRARRKRERMARKMRTKLKKICSSIQTGIKNDSLTDALSTFSNTVCQSYSFKSKASGNGSDEVDIEFNKFLGISEVRNNSLFMRNVEHNSITLETSPKLVDCCNLEYSKKSNSIKDDTLLNEDRLVKINSDECKVKEETRACKVNYVETLPTDRKIINAKPEDQYTQPKETAAILKTTEELDNIGLKTDYDVELQVESDQQKKAVIMKDFQNLEKENSIVFSFDKSNSQQNQQVKTDIFKDLEEFSMDDNKSAISFCGSQDKTDSSDSNLYKLQVIQDNTCENLGETLRALSDNNVKEISFRVNQMTELLLSPKPNQNDCNNFLQIPPKPAGDLAATKFERLFDKNNEWMAHLKICGSLDSAEMVQTLKGTRKRKSNFIVNFSSDSEDEDLQRNVLNFDFLTDNSKIKPKKLCVPINRQQKQRQAKSKEAREKYLDAKYKIPSLFSPPKSKKTKQEKHNKVKSDNFTESHVESIHKKTKISELEKPYACFDVSDRIKEVKEEIPTQPLINIDEYLKNRKKGESLPTAKEFLKYLTDQRIVNAVLRNVPGLYDLNFMTPRHIEHIVNVAQVSGTRAQNVTTQNSQTSTQVTPHIQRIGQPVTRVLEHKPPDVSLSASALISPTISTAVGITQPKPVSTQPSTLINILSQQIRPGQNIVRTVRPATGPLINILSQQIIRPGPVGAPMPQVQKVLISSESLTSTELLQPTVIKLETKEGTASTVATTIITTKPINAIANSTSKVLTSTATSSQGSTILQFICKSSLPKFQQAFGKCVSYQKQATTVTTEIVTPVVTPVVMAQAPSTVQTSTTSATSSTVTATLTPVAPVTIETKKIVPAKTVPINVQPLAGNVIYRGQVPVGQTISLIPPGSTTRQLFRITGTTNDQMTLVKETVIQNKMHALLAAALQAKPKTSQESNGQTEEAPPTRITLCKPNTPGTITNARIVKPVQVQIPTGATIRTQGPQSNNATNVSSTTLEQLREFDMVYKQVKERSSTSSTTSEATNSPVEIQDCPPQADSQPQRISFAYVQNPVQKFTQLSPVVVVSSYNHLPTATSGSPTLTVISQGNATTQAATCTLPKIASKNSKTKSSKSSTVPLINHMIKAAATIPKAPPKPQEDEQTTQRIFDILAEYAEQLRNSPDLNNKPAPRRRSNPPTNPSSSSKRRKSSTSKKTGTNSSVETDTDDWTMGSEDSSNGNVALSSATDDEQSQQSAPISTPPEPQTPQPQVLNEFKPAISQATSVSITPTAAVTSSTNTRPFILTDQNQTTNITQPRNVIIADSSVGEALKIQNTALIVPGSYIVPVSMVKGAQQIVQISGGNKFLTTVPTRPGQNMLVFQGFLNQNRKVGMQTVKYSTIQPLTSITAPNISGIAAQQQVVLPPNVVTLGQPLGLKKFEKSGNKTGNEIFLTISQPKEPTNLRKVIDKVSSQMSQPDSSTNASSAAVEIKIEDIARPDENATIKVITDFPKTSAVATSVIASCVKEEIIDHNTPVDIITDDDIKMVGTDQEIKVEEPRKLGERIKSVLVNASSSNGPMLSHTNSRYRKRSESAETIISSSSHNGEKVSNNEPKIFNTKSYFRTKKHVLSTANKKLESEMQKQAALERELRLQKSLSEECEDLGVDEPSTSDLFPEADLLFDANHSPAYEHTEIKKSSHAVSKTDKGNNMIFSDDENSGPMQADVLFDYVEYPVGQTVDYPPQLLNGNTESVSCDDNTLLANTNTMQEVTLNSPISADIYTDTQPTNKYKYKYSNRKRNEKYSKSESPTVDKIEVGTYVDVISKSSSETPTELDNSIEKSTTATVVSKFGTATVQKESTYSKCQIHCKTEEDPKRGTRRSMKKLCACCNGSKSSAASTLPKKRPLTPSKSPKRALPNKKR